MNRPQTNFIDTARADFPPPIDLRGDVRPNPYAPVTDENSAQYEAWLVNGDILPLPPGTDDLPDACYLPPSALTPSELRLVAHMQGVQDRLLADMARDQEQAMARFRSADPPHEPLSPTLQATILRRNRILMEQAGLPDHSDALRAELERLHTEPPTGIAEAYRAGRPWPKPPSGPPRATDSPAPPSPPQLRASVPDGLRVRIEADTRIWQPDPSPFVSDLGSASEASGLEPLDRAEVAAGEDARWLRDLLADWRVYLALVVCAAVIAAAAVWGRI